MEQFWSNDPTVLLNNKYITQLWPRRDASLESKLNSITRIAVLLTILGYGVTRNIMLLYVLGVTLVATFVYYGYNKDRQSSNIKKQVKKTVEEGFTNPELYEATKPLFTQPSAKNPMMNISLPEIQSNPNRKRAAPAFNPKVKEEIESAVKKNLDERLFHDLGDNIDFETSMRGFYTTPNTQIPNDQKAFAEFCYGSMKSCKDGDSIQCEKKNYRHITP